MNPTLNKRRLQPAIIGLLLAVTLDTSYALSTDKNQPYIVNSDTVLYQRNKHLTTYKGHVIAKQGTTTIQGNKLIISSSPQTGAVEQMIAYGKQAHYSTLPDHHKQKLFADADTIKYWPQKGKVLLIENARVSQQGNLFRGGLIWYDITNQTVLSGRDQTTKTTIIIQPQNKAKQTP